MGAQEKLLLQTKTYRILRARLTEAAEEGVNAIIYGPPSSEKSHVLEHLCEQFRDAGKPVVYAYCPPRCTLNFLYRTIADAAGIATRSTLRWACRYAVLKELRAPALVLDEAQHLDMDSLEAVREVYDVLRRAGRPCGIILAGSHNLLREIQRRAIGGRLEQMLSRFGYRVQLEGMSEKEIVSLASKAFGNGKPAKLSDEQQKILLKRCEVVDPYFIGDDGKGVPRTYYSSRRLLEYVRQTKKNVAGEEHAAA
jgi:DNA transposition AAA+ family ATPase